MFVTMLPFPPNTHTIPTLHDINTYLSGRVCFNQLVGQTLLLNKYIFLMYINKGLSGL